MKPEDRPIGYWLRALDRRIEQAFADRLATRGLRRRHWQVLNGLGPDDPFWGAGEVTHADVVADLTARGWLAADGSLTAAGEDGRAAIAREVDELRGRITHGIADADYLTTVRTLAAMTANVDR